MVRRSHEKDGPVARLDKSAGWVVVDRANNDVVIGLHCFKAPIESRNAKTRAHEPLRSSRGLRSAEIISTKNAVTV
jgi:hypothetical protein